MKNFFMRATFSLLSWRRKTAAGKLIYFIALLIFVIVFVFLIRNQDVFEILIEKLHIDILSSSGFNHFHHEATCESSTFNPAPEPKTFWSSPTIKCPRNITILMWTSFYGLSHVGPLSQINLNHELNYQIKHFSPVPEWCNVTFNRSKLKESDAVVFFHSNFIPTDLPPRNKSQPWVYYALESPVRVAMVPEAVNKIFNRTMTYRLDSDYLSPHGYVTKRACPLPENPYFANRKFPRKRKKFIAWTVSHCTTSSKRELLVDYITGTGRAKVDVYGDCGQLKCEWEHPHRELNCYKFLGKSYKFYLSFENSVCKDYITEKFINALYAHMVPVVYGGGDYEAIIPPYPKPGFINVRDYRTAMDLVDYLNYLDKNETAYAEYFEWKQYYELHINQEYSGFRKLCYDMQNGTDMRYKNYDDMYKWWTLDAHCAFAHTH